MAAEPEQDLKLEIAHVLTIDVVGFSKLLVNEQIDLMRELNQAVRAAGSFREAEANEKMIRLPTGDGMVLLFFRSPEQPVRCALEISEALIKRPDIGLRMGIHSGPVNQLMDVNDQINMAGAGINIGQRVMDCGDAGHILLSKHVAEDLVQYRHWQSHLHDLGECEVKHGLKLHVVNLYNGRLGNPATPSKLQPRGGWAHPNSLSAWLIAFRPWSKAHWLIALLIGFALFLTGAVLVRWSGRVTHTQPTGLAFERSVAVLPFENRSEEKANAYFADGIQDEILTRLSKIANLRVISRTSTQHYKSAPENLLEIARQLNVAYILEGSVQKSGEMVRVNVQLIKAADDSHLWAETFDRKLTDIFSVESDIAKAITEHLRIRLTGQEEQLIAAKYTTVPEAYDAYLRGLAYTLKPGNSTTNALGAQRYLREAVQLDPKFAVGWALLSYTDAVGYLTTALQPTAALREEARQAAATALSLQPKLGEALLAQGQYHYACLKDYKTAAGYFQEARQLLPNSSRISESLAYLARRRGEWTQSNSHFLEAEQLDPRNVIVLTEHAFLYLALRRFPEAQRKCDQILEITPDDIDTLALQANVYLAAGNLADASLRLAAIHPAASDIGPLETQAYLAILERQPSAIIPGLKRILAKPDSASGYFNAELRFWLGWAQDLAGDRAAAEESWRKAKDEFELFLRDQPENDVLISNLALLNMCLGNKAEALSLAERAMAANPIEKDAIAGPRPIEILARVAAGIGDHERAIAALKTILGRPYAGVIQNIPLTEDLLRLDPMFDPLRGDARFQELIAPPASK